MIKTHRETLDTTKQWKCGNYYLGIQLIEYLANSLRVYHSPVGACCLGVKFIDYLPTSSEFITHPYEDTGRTSANSNYTGRYTFLSASGLYRCQGCLFIFFFVVEFSKSGLFGVPPPNDQQCLHKPNREDTYHFGYVDWSGSETDFVDGRRRLRRKPLDEDTTDVFLRWSG